MEKNVPIGIDEIFKIVMSKYENRKYLQEFLEAILHRNISSIMYVGTEVLLEKDYAKDKDMKLDLLVQFDDDEIIDVEIQNKNAKEIFERSLAYSSRLLYNDYKVGDNYTKGRKSIIWIMDFNLGVESKEYHEIYSYKNKDSTDVKKYIEHHFIQLPKFIEQVKEIKTEEEKWLAYFSGQLNKEELEGLYKMSKSIKEINEIVEAAMTDPKVKAVLEAKEARKIERYFDRKDGYLDGIDEERKNIAKKMLKKGKTIEEIIEFTNLTREELEELKKEL